MNIQESTRKLWGFLGRFTLVHVVIYTLFSMAFLAIQNVLPSSTQLALETFEPYRPIGFMIISGQILRSIVIALLLYPFYDIIVRGKHSLLVLFGALWGIALLGSVEPMPGSIEGMIYTEIPFFTHFLVLIVSALEVLLFSGIFLSWERKSNIAVSHEQDKVNSKFAGFAFRFTLLHVITYATAGILLFFLQSYEEAFAIPGRFELYRPLDDPIVTAAIPLQIIRGGLLSIFFYPFYDTFVSRKSGWVLLFGLTFGLIALGGPNFLTGVLTDIVSATPLSEFLIGPVEITAQMLLFSVLLFMWERRRMAKVRKKKGENSIKE